MCLNETYSTDHISKNLFDKFPIQNGFKEGDVSSSLLFNIVIKRVQENQEGLKLYRTRKFLAYVDYVVVVRETIDTIQKNIKVLLNASKEVGNGMNSEKTKYMLTSRCQKAGQRQSINIANRSFKHVAKFKYLGTTLTDQNCTQEEIKCRLNTVNASCHSVQSFIFPPAV
jgi:hypothetical protein